MSTYNPANLGPVGQAVRANVRALRKAQGLRQVQLAAKFTQIGYPLRGVGISHIESGHRRVSVDDLDFLAQALDVPIGRLLEPWVCETCDGEPAPRFTCRDCGMTGD